MRIISELSAFAYTPTFIKMLEDGELKPFHAFYDAFFDGLTEQKSLMSGVCDKLQRDYLDFLRTNPELAGLNLDMKGNLVHGNIHEAQNLKTFWEFGHYHFLPYTLNASFEIIHLSKLQQGDFKLPALPEPERMKRFTEAATQLIQAYTGERDRRIKE